jgi:hypothetical protein
MIYIHSKFKQLGSAPQAPALLLVILILFSANLTNAKGLDIIYQYHQLSGQISSRDGYTYSYSCSSENPIHCGEKEQPNDLDWSYAETKFGSINVDAASSGYAFAKAESQYTFLSTYDGINLIFFSGYSSNWDGIAKGSASLSLIDLTINNTIFAKEFTPGSDVEDPAVFFNESFSFTSIYNHSYLLSLYAEAVSFEGYTEASINVEFLPAHVPEPRTILLVGVGMALVLFHGRKRISNHHLSSSLTCKTGTLNAD